MADSRDLGAEFYEGLVDRFGKAIPKLKDNIDKAGEATKKAAKEAERLEGALKEADKAAEDLSKKFAEGLEPKLKKLDNVIDSFAGKFEKIPIIGKAMSQSIRKFGVGVRDAFKSRATIAFNQQLAKMGAVTASGASGLQMLKAKGTAAFKGIGAALKAAFLNPIGLAVVAIAGILLALVAVGKAVINFDNKTKAVAKNLGISNTEARALYRNLQEVSNTSDHLLFTTSALAEAHAGIANSLGFTAKFTKDTVQGTALMSKYMGLSADEAGTLATLFAVNGESVEDSALRMIQVTEEIKKSTGASVNFRAVLNDIATSGEYIQATFGRSAIELSAVASNAKLLGFNLKQVDGIAGNLLNIEQGLASEMEYMALSGRQISLDAAREAAARNDMGTVMQEIVKAAGSYDAFVNSSRIEQQSLAGALNMSADELVSIVKQQKISAQLGIDSARARDLESRKFADLNNLEKERLRGYYDQTTLSEKLAALQERFGEALNTALADGKLNDLFLSLEKALSDPETIKSFVESIASVAKGISTIFGMFSGESAVTAGLKRQAENQLQGRASYMTPKYDFIMRGDTIQPFDKDDIIIGGTNLDGAKGGGNTGGGDIYIRFDDGTVKKISDRNRVITEGGSAVDNTYGVTVG